MTKAKTTTKKTRKNSKAGKALKNINGAGSLHLRVDGRWEGTVWVPTTTGTMKQLRFYHRDKEAVEAKVTKAKANSLSGNAVPELNLRIRDYLLWWLEWIAKPNVRPSTYAFYETIVRLYLIPGIGTIWLRQLRTGDIRALYLRIKNTCQCCSQGKDAVRKPPIELTGRRRKQPPGTRKCCALPEPKCCGQFPSDSYIKAIHRTLRAAIQDAIEEELHTTNVAHHVHPKGTTDVPKPFDIAEAGRFLATAMTHIWHALFSVAIHLGLRKGELLALRWCDVDLRANELRVRHTLRQVKGVGLVLGDPKTRASVRDVDIPDPVNVVLHEHKEAQQRHFAALGIPWDDTVHVFASAAGTPIGPRNVNRAFAALCDAAGLRRIRFHDLRHTCASILFARGVETAVISVILGHSSKSVTEDVYIDIFSATKKAAMTKLNDLYTRHLPVKRPTRRTRRPRTRALTTGHWS